MCQIFKLGVRLELEMQLRNTPHNYAAFGCLCSH